MLQILVLWGRVMDIVIFKLDRAVFDKPDHTIGLGNIVVTQTLGISTHSASGCSQIPDKFTQITMGVPS